MTNTIRAAPSRGMDVSGQHLMGEQDLLNLVLEVLSAAIPASNSQSSSSFSFSQA